MQYKSCRCVIPKHEKTYSGVIGQTISHHRGSLECFYPAEALHWHPWVDFDHPPKAVQQSIVSGPESVRHGPRTIRECLVLDGIEFQSRYAYECRERMYRSSLLSTWTNLPKQTN